jgi:predicted MFS family arabinose efflux permease
MQGSMSAASVAGPGIAGVAVQAIGAARAVGLDALSFLVSAISVLAIRTAEAPRVRQRAGVRRDIGVGLRFVFGHPILGRLYLATALGMIGAHVLDAVMYPFMYNQLHLVPAQLGLILATAATGSIAGVLLSPWFVRRLGLGRVVGGFMAGFCLALFALPLALLFPPAIVIVPAFWLSTMFDAVQNINQLSLRQALTPESMQGRMHSVVRTVTWTALPVSSLLGGIAANYLGPVTTLLAGGTVGVLGSVAVLLSPAGRIQEFPAAPATDAPASPDH